MDPFALLRSGRDHENASNWSQAVLSYQRALAAIPISYGVTPWFQRYILEGADPPDISVQQLAGIYDALARCLNQLNRKTDSRLAFHAARCLNFEIGQSTDEHLTQDKKPSGSRVDQNRDRFYLQSRLTLVFFTHCTNKLKTNTNLSPPSTRLLETTFNSLVSNVDPLLKGCKKILCIDTQNQTTVERQYVQNIEAFADENGFDIIVGHRQGLRGMILKAMQSVKTPYLFMAEHDWRFAGPPLCMDYLIRVFDSFPWVHLVRFNQRPNHIARYDFIIEKERTIPYPPLLKTAAHSNNPSLLRVSTLQRKWLPICLNDPVYGSADLGGTAFGVEEPLFKKHINDIHEYGFEKAHQQWGTYILGNPGDRERIVHIGW